MHPPGVSSHLFDDIICKLYLITKYYDSTRLYTLSYTCIFFFTFLFNQTTTAYVLRLD